MCMPKIAMKHTGTFKRPQQITVVLQTHFDEITIVHVLFDPYFCDILVDKKLTFLQRVPL